MQKQEIIQTFKQAGWQGTASDRKMRQLLADAFPDAKEWEMESNGNIRKWVADRTVSRDGVWCSYKGHGRLISPQSCEWHRQEKDPECEECDRGWMNFTD